MPAGAPTSDLLDALQSTKVAAWTVPLDRVAVHLRAVLIKQGLAYEDLGLRAGYGVTMEAFAIVGKDLSIILFAVKDGGTALAFGEGIKTPRGLGKRILDALEENLQKRKGKVDPPSRASGATFAP